MNGHVCSVVLFQKCIRRAPRCKRSGSRKLNESKGGYAAVELQPLMPQSTPWRSTAQTLTGVVTVILAINALALVVDPTSKLSSTRRARSEHRTRIERTKPAKEITDASGIHNVEVSS